MIIKKKSTGKYLNTIFSPYRSVW